MQTYHNGTNFLQSIVYDGSLVDRDKKLFLINKYWKANKQHIHTFLMSR